MRIFVRHDAKGNIISTLKTSAMGAGIDHPFGNLDEGDAVVEIESKGDLEDLDAHRFMEQYSVDVKKRQLKKKRTKLPPER